MWYETLLITEPPSHRRLSACVGVHCVPPHAPLLRMSSVTCGYHGDASEKAGGAEVNVQHVGEKAVSPAQ